MRAHFAERLCGSRDSAKSSFLMLFLSQASATFLVIKVSLLSSLSVTCSHPPCNFAARGGGFSLKATDVASIDELSPCAPRFRFL